MVRLKSLTHCAVSGKSLYFPVPQFSHVSHHGVGDEDSSGPCPQGLMRIEREDRLAKTLRASHRWEKCLLAHMFSGGTCPRPR